MICSQDSTSGGGHGDGDDGDDGVHDDGHGGDGHGGEGDQQVPIVVTTRRSTRKKSGVCPSTTSKQVCGSLRVYVCCLYGEISDVRKNLTNFETFIQRRCVHIPCLISHSVVFIIFYRRVCNGSQTFQQYF